MAERLRSFAAEVGLVFVDKAQEKASVFRTAKRYNPGSGRSYPWLVKSTAMVNHYYTRRRRPRLRPVLSQVLYLFPYTAKLCLNGHEYAKRQLAGDGIAFQALDNGVQNCADPHRLQQICDGLSAETIEGLLREWLDRLPHHRPVHRRLFFEQVIRENLDLGRPEQVQLIFNRKITRATPGRFRTRVRQIRSSNLTYSQNIP
jgi:hypothetical protein